ncbi:MAG: patatin-like phospholipase family protein [Candidatus Marinimicrobia bacterium]|nr:patatin-like phospholipase family protein [Candidatus Neomarinimicrobiota bacterium]
MTIKHLVISGGGPTLIHVLGAIQQLEKQEFICLKNIETIYGTSAGAIVGVLICLGYDWETINDYVIKRPWHDVFPIKVQSIFDAYTKKGIFDISTIEKCFKPLLDAKDISMSITLEEFFALSHIELHLFSFEMNEYKMHDISYLTHPKLSLIQAIQMTCSLPLLISPVCIDDKCYIDGGVFCNYPLNYCIESGKSLDEILGFKNNYCSDNIIINTDSTLMDFLLSFIFKAVFSVNTDHNQPALKNEVICDAKNLSIDVLRSAINNIDVRRELYSDGVASAIRFLSYLENSV